jgi:hypothetical protein
MSTTIAERVAAGAEWLDVNRPGWVDRINLETLNLSSPCRCILGQELGDYCEAPYELIGWPSDDDDERDDSRAVELGFNIPSSWMEYDYEALTAEWRRYIEARRESVSA